MVQPFQVEISDRDGRVVAVAEITEMSDETYLGRMLRNDFSRDISEILEEYHATCESGSMSYLDVVLARLLAFELRVVGLPGKGASVPLRDFQLGPDGLFSLMVD